MVGLREPDIKGDKCEQISRDKHEIESPLNLIKGNAGCKAQPNGRDGLGKHGESNSGGSELQREDLGYDDPDGRVEEEGPEEGKDEDEGHSCAAAVGVSAVGKLFRERREDDKGEEDRGQSVEDCSPARPVVGHGEDADRLADYCHEAVERGDEQDGPTFVSEVLVHNRLIILYNVAAGKLCHVDNQASEKRTSHILPRE